MHPATLDGCDLSRTAESAGGQFLSIWAISEGTIHVLGATMVGWDAPLKIFSGMGRVQAARVSGLLTQSRPQKLTTVGAPGARPPELFER